MVVSMDLLGFALLGLVTGGLVAWLIVNARYAARLAGARAERDLLRERVSRPADRSQRRLGDRPADRSAAREPGPGGAPGARAGTRPGRAVLGGCERAGPSPVQHRRAARPDRQPGRLAAARPRFGGRGVRWRCAECSSMPGCCPVRLRHPGELAQRPRRERASRCRRAPAGRQARGHRLEGADDRVPRCAGSRPRRGGSRPAPARPTPRRCVATSTLLPSAATGRRWTPRPRWWSASCPGRHFSGRRWLPTPSCTSTPCAATSCWPHPATLLALLRTVAYTWRQEALTEGARELLDLGRQLYDRLGALGRHTEKLGATLRRSVEAYNALVGSLEGRVLVTTRRMTELGPGHRPGCHAAGGHGRSSTADGGRADRGPRPRRRAPAAAELTGDVDTVRREASGCRVRPSPP